jgi:exopolysaccharide biosynthesis polyprenyl glycosylphosphotransferase
MYWPLLWQWSALGAVAGFVLVSISVGAAILAQRHLLDRAIYRVAPVSPGAARTLVIGTRAEMRHASQSPALADRRTFRLCARFDARQYAGAGGESLEDALCRSIRRHRIDTVLMAGPLDDGAFRAVLSAASVSGCAIFSLARSFVLGALEPSVIWMRGAPIVRLNRPSLLAYQQLLKRIADVLVAGTALLLASPVLLLIAVGVRVTSPGPILFRQARVGLGGRTFQILKFRSMVADAEERRRNLIARSLYRDPRLFKMKDDPRVTPFGRFLRRTSLDELPQLWNVLIGDMSLVGPRPPLPSEVELYETHHYARFEVKPGITGPWQVGGRNQLTDFEAVVALETAYIRDWNIWKDMSILLRTVPVVLTGRGAH